MLYSKNCHSKIRVKFDAVSGRYSSVIFSLKGGTQKHKYNDKEKCKREKLINDTICVSGLVEIM